MVAGAVQGVEPGSYRGLTGAVRRVGGWYGATGARLLLDSSYELHASGVVRADIAEVVVQGPANVSHARVEGRGRTATKRDRCIGPRAACVVRVLHGGGDARW